MVFYSGLTQKTTTRQAAAEETDFRVHPPYFKNSGCSFRAVIGSAGAGGHLPPAQSLRFESADGFKGNWRAASEGWVKNPAKSYTSGSCWVMTQATIAQFRKSLIPLQKCKGKQATRPSESFRRPCFETNGYCAPTTTVCKSRNLTRRRHASLTCAAVSFSTACG